MPGSRRTIERDALKHPQRVLSLTFIGTSAFDEDDPDLPPLEPALL